jgi:fructose-1,6-bisphosphatase II
LLDKPLNELTISVLNRERHRELIHEMRAVNVRIKLLSDGDVAGAMAPAFPETGIDLYVGSGGAPEGVLVAAALKCFGGEIQGRLMIENEEQRNRCIDMGISCLNQILLTGDMVGSDDVIFAATGVTDGDFLEGVHKLAGGRVETNSLVTRASTKTIRYISSIHHVNER